MDDLDPTRPGTPSSTTRRAFVDPRSGPRADCVSSSVATLPAIRPPRIANTPARPAINPIAGASDGRCGQPARGFLPRRLSDAGRDPGRTRVDGRHLKPFTKAACPLWPTNGTKQTSATGWGRPIAEGAYAACRPMESIALRQEHLDGVGSELKSQGLLRLAVAFRPSRQHRSSLLIEQRQSNCSAPV